MKILIIEDEKELSMSIASYLKSEEYHCEVAADFNAALHKTESYDYDCILLDINLPGGSGLDILRNMKKNNKMDGVLIISARNSIEDKVKGLKLGADDYLQKPFHLSELSARVASIIRRRNFGGNDMIAFNDILINMREKEVRIRNNKVDLTKMEFDMLLYFVSNKRKVISKNALAEHLCDDDNYNSIDFIYTHIKNLRKKLQEAGSPDYLKSVYGMGYKLTDA